MEHFCTCKATGCKNHPLNQPNGCDPCIKKNLANGEVPACFWLKIADDMKGIKSYTFKDFCSYYENHKEAYEAQKKDA